MGTLLVIGLALLAWSVVSWTLVLGVGGWIRARRRALRRGGVVELWPWAEDRGRRGRPERWSPGAARGPSPRLGSRPVGTLSGAAARGPTRAASGADGPSGAAARASARGGGRTASS